MPLFNVDSKSIMELTSRPLEARSYNVSPETMLDQLKTTSNIRMTPDLIKFTTQSMQISPTAKAQPLKAYRQTDGLNVTPLS